MTTKKNPQFEPHWVLSGPIAQTLGGLYWPQEADLPPALSHQLRLDDGDALQLFENRPPGWHDGSPIVVLVHGLAGTWQSNYMIRFCRRFIEQGFLVLRINQRGCGPGFGLALKPAHSGRSEDTRQVVEWLGQRFSKSAVSLIGISQGGNISLKMCAEESAATLPNLAAVVAVSPPIDLQATAYHLQRSLFRHLDLYFTYKLYTSLKNLQKIHPELTVPKLSRWSLHELDQKYTAPQSGFADRSDYYSRCSSKPLLPNITIPTLILMSLDDPIVGPDAYEDLQLSPSTEVVLTDKGGHVGFLGYHGSEMIRQGKKSLLPSRWMDEVIVEWVNKLALPK
jgi:predicted alpha/beta-fold hydrolase